MKAITAKVLASSFLVVTVFTLFLYRTGAAVWFYVLYPGSALSLHITGGHGGTKFQEGLALIASLMMNTVAYAALCAGLLAVRNRGRAALQRRVQRSP
jgi:hypothetical protein